MPKTHVRLDGETVWLTRQQLADLFNRNYTTISKHINNALKEELEGEEVVAKYANTTQHGAMEGKTQTHEVEYFNLEMVSSVGYRVKSKDTEGSVLCVTYIKLLLSLKHIIFQQNHYYIKNKATQLHYLPTLIM